MKAYQYKKTFTFLISLVVYIILTNFANADSGTLTSDKLNQPQVISKEKVQKQSKGSTAKESNLSKSSRKEITMNKEIAILAGGCFWGVEELFRQLKGVQSTQVGYTGGVLPNPTYNDVKKGTTGHAEAIQITFNPIEISYEDILKYFFRLHDPTTLNQQGNDRGTQYRSAIFYMSDKQKDTAERVKIEVDNSKKWKNPVVTEIVKASVFYSAEDYHQDYLQKNPGGYTCHFLRD